MVTRQLRLSYEADMRMPLLAPSSMFHLYIRTDIVVHSFDDAKRPTFVSPRLRLRSHFVLFSIMSIVLNDL